MCRMRHRHAHWRSSENGKIVYLYWVGTAQVHAGAVDVQMQPPEHPHFFGYVFDLHTQFDRHFSGEKPSGGSGRNLFFVRHAHLHGVLRACIVDRYIIIGHEIERSVCPVIHYIKIY